MTAKEICRDVRLSCASCGKSKNWDGDKSGSVVFCQYQSSYEKGQFTIGDAVDAFFHYPLWLQEKCGENILWAYNSRHLSFLRNYVSATLRERSIDEKWGHRNSLLESTLPKWIKLAKNREAIMRAVERLERSIE